MDGEVVFRDEAFEALIPSVDVGALDQDDFGVRVGGDELLGEADAGRIGHGAVVSEQAVPVLAREGGAVVVVFGFEGGGPGGEVVEVVEGCVAVVGGFAAEEFEGGLHGDCAGTGHA